MIETYALVSRRSKPNQVPAYIEYRETPDLKVFRMWINPDVPIEELHLKFRGYAQLGKFEFDHHETLEFIKARVFEPGYEDLENVLKYVGIPYYDAWEIFKKYRGKCSRDDLEAVLIKTE